MLREILDTRMRKILLFSLLVAFAIQTYFVYEDKTALQQAPLSFKAREGQKTWLAHNCQSCHQIYGFGGFLGPDLTNAAQRLTPQRLESVLTLGSPQMPAYHFSKEEQESLLSFFQELDKTGVGTPSHTTEVKDPVLHFHTSLEILKTDSSVEKGVELARNYSCISCHLPNTKSVYQAPDLTLIVKNRSVDEIHKVLTEGRLEKGMPKLPLTEQDKQHLLVFLIQLNSQREDILRRYSGPKSLSMLGLLKTIPWFEYD